MDKVVTMIQVSPEELKELITEGIKAVFVSTAPASDKSELLSIDEAAAFLRVSRQTIYNWRKERKILSYNINSKVYFKKEELLNQLKYSL